ncbi:MAG: Rhodanese- sulfurtransferase [Chaenotheca gracillima]|nr:MAG: Rhodanese- sulfurtransferase [Chaenotheca gracillima]
MANRFHERPHTSAADQPPTISTSSLPLPPQNSISVPQSPTTSSLPPLPSSPKSSAGPSEQRKPFFLNSKASKSSSRLFPSETIRQVSEGDLTTAGVGESQMYRLRQNSGSSPDLPLAEGRRGSEPLIRNDESSRLNPISRRPVGAPNRAQSAIPENDKGPGVFKKNKPRPFHHLLNRTRSIRVEPPTPTPRSATKRPSTSRFAVPDPPSRNHENSEVMGLKTAPLAHEGDRSFRDMMSSTIRNRSADRQPTPSSESGSVTSLKETMKHSSSFSSSFRDGTGASLLSGLRNSSTKAADGLGKAGKGIFGKLTRSGSSGEKEIVSDENYVCHVITLPLVEQTRRTRIGKRLEHSKDKTEFWMPALPWRCIDYLNYKGCEEEGLYRIPGSGPRVKEWQRRFDTGKFCAENYLILIANECLELDINLFDAPDLYDINIIGSMFKAWLRELPDEIFPKATQEHVARECMGATEVPQLLKDELSKLPPFNYYLLFAITCHLSLLHSYVDKNKMDYRNLCICFQPCLRIDGFCFQFLVCHWKQCWQGCWTEKDALLEEYRVLEKVTPSSAGESTETSQDVDERAISSSGSSEPPAITPIVKTRSTEKADRPRPPPLKHIGKTPSQDGSGASTHTPSALSTPIEGATEQAPELAPMVPLSPLGL